MRKAAILVLALAISASWLDALTAAQTSDKTSGRTTLEGCLRYTGNHYRITDSSGQVHQLVDEANKLTHYVGQQVEVTGKTGVKSISTTISGVGSTVREQPVFEVRTVKPIADTCPRLANE